MENASKALLIAAAALIAILLLSLFAYLMTRMSENTARIHAIMEESTITEFNQQFLNFEGRGTNIKQYNKNTTDNTVIPQYNISSTDINQIYNTPLTAQDVVTIINLADNSNKLNKWPFAIEVLVDNAIISNTEDFLMQNIETKYKCSSIEIDASTKIVKKVTILKITVK